MLTQRTSHKQIGFTIVELLVVIVVLGILVSLSYFAFNSWRDRVAETELKSDLNGLYSAMESARNWSNGYPALAQGTVFDGNTTTKAIFTQSDNVKLTYYQGDSKTYCVDAVSKARPSISMFLSTKDGNKEPKKGTCMLGEGSTPQVPGQPIAWLGVANGQLHSLGLAANGTVYAWGSNSNGQLGTNNTTDSPNPVAVTTAGTPMAGKKIIGVAAGHTSSYAIDESGTVYSWGGNSRGRLGDGTTTDRLVPVAVVTAGTPMAGKKIISIAASYTQDNSMNTHVIALADDGTVYTWGSGDYGSLGRGSTASSSVPVAVTTAGTPMAGKKIISVAAGPNYSIALSDEGDVYSWGGGWSNNPLGRIGDNSNTQRLVPVAVTTAGTPMAGKKIISVAAGAVAVAAVSSDGSIFAWGGNAQGALGQRTTSGPSTCSSYACSMIPVEVSKTGSSLSGKQPVQVTATGASFAVLDSTGDIHFWSSSQLTPAKLLNQGDSTIRSISGDTNGSISGVTGSGSVYTWSFTLSTTKSPSKTTTVYYP